MSVKSKLKDLANSYYLSIVPQWECVSDILQAFLLAVFFVSPLDVETRIFTYLHMPQDLIL